tara:strand:- start:3912 stop:4802 length:891 start_codon:yes stop_codon:yes gene_type:complete
MADVVQKIISGNDIQQGVAVSHVTQTGNIHNVVPNVTNAISISEAETKWTSRFDDTEYYGTVFKPTIISGCQVWLAANKITGLSDGDVVTTWSDSSGQSNDFTQSTASKKPLYKTNIFNTRPAIKFDGVDDFLLSVPGSEVTGSTAYSVFAVFKFVGESNWITPLAIGAGGNPMMRFFQLDGATPRNIRAEGKNAGNTALTEATGSDVDLSATYVGSLINGSTASQYLNGVADASDDAFNLSDHSLTRFTLGSASTPANYASCYISEVAFYNREVTAPERRRIEGYFGRKYGVTMP